MILNMFLYLHNMIISSIRIRNFPEDEKDQFPWTLPLVKEFTQIEFESPISFFVGENGSGKSTILESIAAATEVPIAGSQSLENDPSLSAADRLASYLSIRYQNRSSHGFFVRAEDFIGFARKIKHEIEMLDKEMEEMKADWTGGDIKLALGPIQGEKDALIKRYSPDLEAMSHGEGFLKFFKSRLTAKGLYLIDEPEAALSPQNQLLLLSLIKEKVEKTGSQFIIATHSPIIMACPESKVLYFDNNQIKPLSYTETDHFKITKAIIDDPNRFLDLL